MVYNSISRAASLLGVSRPTLYRYMADLEIKPQKVLGHPALTTYQLKELRLWKKERQKVKKRRNHNE